MDEEANCRVDEEPTCETCGDILYPGDFQKFRWYDRMFIAMLFAMSFAVYAAVKFYGQERYGYAIAFIVFSILFGLCAFEWRYCFGSTWNNFIKSIEKSS